MTKLDFNLTKLFGIFSGMPLTNRETAAEKAAAHKWLEKERARRKAKNLRILEKLRKARES